MASGVLLGAAQPLGMGEAFEPSAAIEMTAYRRPPSLPTLCHETGGSEQRDLVFEWVEPGDLDAEDIRRVSGGNREVVAFHWSEQTGELSFDTSAPTAVFSDVAASLPTLARRSASCGSP